MSLETTKSSNEGTKESDKQETSPNPNISPIPVEPHPQIPPHGHYAPCKKQRDVWDRFKYGLEVVGIVSLLFYTVFAGCQVKIANDTLCEIKNSGTDTHNLAKAAGEQAKALGQQLALQREIAAFGHGAKIGVTGIAIFHDDEHGVIEAGMVVQNDGNVDATKIAIAGKIDFRKPSSVMISVVLPANLDSQGLSF